MSSTIGLTILLSGFIMSQYHKHTIMSTLFTLLFTGTISYLLHFIINILTN